MSKSARRAAEIHNSLQSLLSELQSCRFVERGDNSPGARAEFLSLLNRSPTITEEQKLVEAVVKQLFRTAPKGKYQAYALWLDVEVIAGLLNLQETLSFNAATRQFSLDAARPFINEHTTPNVYTAPDVRRGQIVRQTPHSTGTGHSAHSRPKKGRARGPRGARREPEEPRDSLSHGGLLRAWGALEAARESDGESSETPEGRGAVTNVWHYFRYEYTTRPGKREEVLTKLGPATRQAILQTLPCANEPDGDVLTAEARTVWKSLSKELKDAEKGLFGAWRRAQADEPNQTGEAGEAGDVGEASDGEASEAGEADQPGEVVFDPAAPWGAAALTVTPHTGMQLW